MAEDLSLKTELNVAWHDDYAVGDAVIDQQHRDLFRLATQLLSATDRSALVDIAMKLYRHVREHFRHEEELMREIGYPEYRAHVQMHDHMIGRLNDLSIDIAAGRWDRARLHAFMQDWVVGHILEEDTRLAVYVRAREDL